MNRQWMLLALFLCGCTEMMEQPTREELDWNPPHLSKTGCPDLSGRYLAPDYLHYRYALPYGSTNDTLFESWQGTQRDRDLPITVVVEAKSDRIGVQVTNGRKSISAQATLDGENTGCDKSVLVYRFILPLRTPGESGGCTRLNYGERRIRLLASGDLSVEESHRNRCSTWGSLKGQAPAKEYTMGPFIFRRIK